MQLNPHLSFNGQCEEAFQLYAKCLKGAEVMLLRYGETPAADQAPADWKDKIIHGTLNAGNLRLTGGDPPPHIYKKPQGMGILLSTSDAAEAERIFNALSANAEIQMPMGETFWATRFGMLTDQFGIPWLINCGRPE